MSLKSYVGRYTMLVQVFAGSLPCTSIILEDRLSWLFPPIGDSEALFRGITFVICVVSALLPYRIPASRNGWGEIRGMFVSCLLFGTIYAFAVSQRVVAIRIPASEANPNGTVQYVVKGGERVGNLPKAFRSLSDEDLIKSTGLSDERLAKVYTKDSLWRARGLLLISYTATLACFQLFLGLIAKHE